MSHARSDTCTAPSLSTTSRAEATTTVHDRAATLARAICRRSARTRVYEVAQRTPLQEAALLAGELGARVLLKREDLQPVFSFKLRGAYNRMARMSPPQCRRGVVASSAGNHAQGVALAAMRMGIDACIVMPCTTPELKVHAVRRLGGPRVQVILHGQTYQEAQTCARRLADTEGRIFVHPFNDVDVIAGQATIAHELLRQADAPISSVFVPVGGGGLIAGMACVLKARHPGIRVYGVQADNSDAMTCSLEQGRRVRLTEVGLFADGTAVKQVGTHTFALCRRYVDGMLRVGENAICHAMHDLYRQSRCVSEPSGALALAGLRRHVELHGPAPGAMIAVVSGANMDFERLAAVAARVPA